MLSYWLNIYLWLWNSSGLTGAQHIVQLIGQERTNERIPGKNLLKRSFFDKMHAFMHFQLWIFMQELFIEVVNLMLLHKDLYLCTTHLDELFLLNPMIQQHTLCGPSLALQRLYKLFRRSSRWFIICGPIICALFVRFPGNSAQLASKIERKRRILGKERRILRIVVGISRTLP